MPYVTIKQAPIYYQMSFEDILEENVDLSRMVVPNVTNTRTHYRENLNEAFLERYNFDAMIETLQKFNQMTGPLAEEDRLSLYNNFYQEKKNKGMSYIFQQIFSSQKKYVECNASEVCRVIAGKINPILRNHSAKDDAEIVSEALEQCEKYLESNGFSITKETIEKIFKSAYRKIDSPCNELKTHLLNLKQVLEESMAASYHTSAFAYVKGRCTIDALKRHQQNESRWFAKFDFSDFFGSTNEEFVMSMFSTIFPFSEIVKRDDGFSALKQALSLCFLNGGLPQGTPISPTITNIMMIPIDHKLYNQLRKMDEHYVYTRYADDILVSSKIDFDCEKLQNFILGVLQEFSAPFCLNKEKTRYGSSAGRNWNLGVMLNKDNKITIGYKKKKSFKAMCCNYICDKKNNIPWELHEVQVFSGLISYYRMVERDYIDYVIEQYNNKFNVNLEALIKKDLS